MTENSDSYPAGETGRGGILAAVRSLTTPTPALPRWGRMLGV